MAIGTKNVVNSPTGKHATWSSMLALNPFAPTPIHQGVCLSKWHSRDRKEKKQEARCHKLPLSQKLVDFLTNQTNVTTKCILLDVKDNLSFVTGLSVAVVVLPARVIRILTSQKQIALEHL